jgi:hypothetical protein
MPTPPNVVRRIFSDVSVKIIAEVLVILIVAGLSGLTGALWRDHRYEQQFDAAPTIYVDQLGKLIENAYNGGPKDVRVNARAVVAARNSLAGSLESVATSLDGEINQLAVQIDQRHPNADLVSASAVLEERLYR